MATDVDKIDNQMDDRWLQISWCSYLSIAKCRIANSKRSSDLPRLDIVEPPIRRHHKYHNHYNHLRRLQAEANSCNYCGRPKQQHPPSYWDVLAVTQKHLYEPARLSIPRFAINPQMEDPYFWTCGPWAIKWAIKWATTGASLGPEAPAWMRTKVRTTDETYEAAAFDDGCCQTPAPKGPHIGHVSHFTVYICISCIVVSCFDPIPGVNKGWDVAMNVTRFE